MIRVLMLVMLLSVLAYGQPVEEPWTVVQHSGDPGVSNPHLVLRNADTADVFYQVGDFVFHATILLQNGEVIAGPSAIFPEGIWQRRLYTVIWTGVGWAALVYDTTAVRHRTLVFEGKDIVQSQTEISSGVFWDGNMTHSGNSDYGFALERRTTGGYIAAWQNSWIYYFSYPPGGWSEGGDGVDVFVNAQDWPHSSFFGDEFGGCHAYGAETEIHYVSDDSLVILESCGDNLTFCITSGQGGGFGLNISRDITCNNQMLKALFTRSGKVYMLSGRVGEASARVIEIQNLATCIDRLTVNNIPIAASSNPNVGMAWLAKPSSGLLLSRLDTNGFVPRYEGVLYWPDIEHQVVEAKLAIADNGLIVALWSERLAGEEDATLLKIVSIGWNTPLDAEDSHSNLYPTSFSLSAYPNPFNSEVQIAYDLPQAQNVELAVFNVLGQKVAILLSGFKAAGSHSEVWKPETGTGIYFISLKAGEIVKTTKVLYLK